MSNSILLGPILGYEDGGFYTVCVLLEPGVTILNLNLPDLDPSIGVSTSFLKVATVGENEFWRAEFPVSPSAAGGTVKYEVRDGDGPLMNPHGRVQWSFYVPGLNEEPLIAYASCNGFSSAKLARDTDQPYALWEKMKLEHSARPYSLLLMGGDQVYADEIWESKRCPNLQRWSEKDWDEQIQLTPGPAMIREIAAFYDWLYLDRWKNETMSLMLATLPSVMMWDDHDIFDGWRSFLGFAIVTLTMGGLVGPIQWLHEFACESSRRCHGCRPRNRSCHCVEICLRGRRCGVRLAHR